MQTCT